MDKLFEWAKDFIKNKPHTFWGLISYLFIGLFISSALCEMLNIINGQLSLFTNPHQVSIILYLGLFLICFLLWLNKAMASRHFSLKPLVIFAIPAYYDESLIENNLTRQEEIKQIKNLYIDLKKGLNKYNITLKIIPHNQIPDNVAKARKLFRIINPHVLIWGEINSGKIRNSNITQIVTLSYFYRFHKTTAQDSLIFAKGIELSLISTLKIIRQDFDLHDRNMISKDIEIGSSFIIALISVTKKKLDSAIMHFNNALNSSRSKQPKSSIDWAFEEIQKIYLAECYALTINKIGTPAYPSIVNRQKICQLLNLGQKMCPESVNILNIGAIVSFWDNDINTAKELLIKAVNIYPNFHHLWFSLAFIYYFDDDIINGWKSIKKAFNLLDKELIKSKVIFRKNIKDIIKFYKHVIKNNPQKIQLLFPFGLILFKYSKQWKGIKNLNQLILKYLNEPLSKERVVMLKKARNIIDQKIIKL